MQTRRCQRRIKRDMSARTQATCPLRVSLNHSTLFHTRHVTPHECMNCCINERYVQFPQPDSQRHPTRYCHPIMIIMSMGSIKCLLIKISQYTIWIYLLCVCSPKSIHSIAACIYICVLCVPLLASTMGHTLGFAMLWRQPSILH